MSEPLRLADLHPGDRWETPGLVVTESHIVAFAGLAGDFFELHMDDDAARARGFPARVAHGLLGLALADGLKNRATRTLDAIASLEWQVRFVAPVFAGDRVHARLAVLETRPTSDGRRGIVRLQLDLLNQHGQTVQQGTNTLMVRA